MSAAYVRVGELACQRNSFLRELTATVVSCAAVPPPPSKKKSSSSAETETYDVVLSDSVLFPEGGGQPCDHGWLCKDGGEHQQHNDNNITADGNGEVIAEITSVTRRGDTCVLSSPVPFSVGQTVKQRVNWARRLDHMQHHTAQHLLSAVVERKDMLHLPTMSWSLTLPYCFIQIDVGEYAADAASPYHQYITKEKKVSEEMIRRIQDACNGAIAQDKGVSCTVFDSRDAYNAEQERRFEKMKQQQQQEREDGSGLNTEEEAAFRSRGIPLDVTGPIRVISLDRGDIDSCTCCGTHLTQLSQLHLLMMLHQEVKGTTVKLYFITGERALTQFGAMYERERALMKELGGCRPEDFVSSVQRRAKETTEAQKLLKRWSLELAGCEVTKILQKLQSDSTVEGGDAKATKAKVIALRRDDVDVDFFNRVRALLNEAGHESVVLLAAWATDCSAAAATFTIVPTKDVPGQISITGADKAAVEEVAALAVRVLDGMKGGMSKQGFRGKGSLKEWRVLQDAIDAL